MSEERTYTKDELASMMQSILDGDKQISTVEEATAMRRMLNPLGNLPKSDGETYVNMTVLNWHKQYLERLHMTAFIGYIYRTLEEYEPTPQIDRMMQQPPSEERDAAITAFKTSFKSAVKQFLDRNFAFNPDIHVRGAHTETTGDSERPSALESIRKQMKAAESAAAIRPRLVKNSDDVFAWIKNHVLESHGLINSAFEDIRVATKAVAIAELHSTGAATDTLADMQGIMMKKMVALKRIRDDLEKIATPLSSAETLASWQEPSANLFHQVDRYLSGNYETLSDIVNAVYSEKPDLEFCINLHSIHDTEEEAREWRIKHENMLKHDVLTIKTGDFHVLGAYKQNRDRLDFYNKNTDVLKMIMQQSEMDQRLGADIMKKAARDKKKKNIEEMGPDAPGFADYHKHMCDVKNFGGKKILTKDEQAKMADAAEKARLIREDYEVPDDCIQVDVFVPTMNADGSGTLERKIMYSAAETPTFLQDDDTQTPIKSIDVGGRGSYHRRKRGPKR